MDSALRDQLKDLPSPVPVLLAGQIVAFTDSGGRSAIAKTPLPGPWTFTRTGLPQDAQADDDHGGPEMALHHYPHDHYAYWSEALGGHPLLVAPGAFGENMSTSGWTEADVHIGDVVAFGGAVLQVSQGRQPCWKLNTRFGHKKMALDVQTTGRTGWYYRVLEPGTAAPGDTMRIVERPHPAWSLQKLIGVLYKHVDDRAALEEMAEMPDLAEQWRAIARKRLASRKTENWTRRLNGRGGG